MNKQPKEIKITLTLRQPLLGRYLSLKGQKEVRCGGKMSHNVIIAELIAAALDPDPKDPT